MVVRHADEMFFTLCHLWSRGTCIGSEAARKTMKPLFWFLLVICCVVIGSAQERVIDRAEFDAAVVEGGKHHLRWKGDKYRMTVTTSSKAVGRPQTDWSSKMVFEYGPAKEMRSVTTSSFGGSANPIEENLTLGSWIYSRTGNEPWTRREMTAVGDAKKGEESTLKVLSSQVEYKYVGQSTLPNGLVHVYAKTERRTRYNEKTGAISETDGKTTYWIDSKGTVLKQEFKSETRGKITSQTFIIFEWMLDPSITFTAPEVVP